MELNMHSHRWEHRTPDWTAAAVAGFVAGALLMVLEMLWSTVDLYASPWVTPNRVAALVLGPDVLHENFDVWVVITALVTHYILGIIFGMILAAIIAPFHLDSSAGMLALVGAIFGLVLYAINFYGMSRFFPWLTQMQGWATVVAHLVFGMSAALMYWQLERRLAAA
jgi:hypothetical protein